MPPGTTPRQAGTADRYRRTARMAVRPRPAPITPTPVFMAQHARARMLTATGVARLRCAATSGHRLHIGLRRQEQRRVLGLRKVRAASGSVGPTGIVASSRKARTTMCTPVRMATFIARTQAAIGSSMRTGAGRIQAPNRRLMLRMRRELKVPRANSVPVRAQPTELALHNIQRCLQRRDNSLTETLRHARRERRGRSSSSGRGRVVRGAWEGEDAGDLSEMSKTPWPT